jgi:hypothetical protein
MATVPLPEGQYGDASFNQAMTRRHWLKRWWGGAAEPAQFALWICMNPSLAGADANDPSMARMVSFTSRIPGVTSLVTVNVYDLIAEKPAALIAPGAEPCSDTNLATILHLAAKAFVIVLGYGTLPPKLRSTARHTVNMLRTQGLGDKLYCLGVTKDASPRHPLYLAGTTPFRLYTETPMA